MSASILLDCKLRIVLHLMPGILLHWFSTDEVYTAIKNLDPSASITKEQVFQAMIDAGFKFQNRPGASGCDFRWMFQERNQ